MRIPKSELTPAIVAEVDRVLGSFYMPATSLEPDRQRQHQAALKAYYAARTSTILSWIAYPSVVLAGMGALLAWTHTSPAWVMVPGLLGLVPLYLAMPTNRGLTVEELRSYLPLISLPPAEETYLEAVIEAYSPGADDSLRSEVLPAMRRLVDESLRLDRLETTLAEGGIGTVGAEVDEMRARLKSIEDPSARGALEEAIRIAERRLGSAISERVAHDRIEAHRAMIRQSALAARETVRRLRLAPESGGVAGTLDLSALRASAEGAGREVAALEAAVQEMRAL